MLSDDLQVVNGAEAGAWIKPALGGEFGAVSLRVPKIFETYARVFHRVADSDGNHVTWGEMAERLGRTAHREMQWHQLVGTSNTFGIEGSNWPGSIPSLGELEIEELDRLCRILAEHTSDLERCFFGLCVISSTVARTLPRGEARKPQLQLPDGRDHVVLTGPLSAIDQIQAPVASGPPGPDLDDPFWQEAPNLIWPADRSWLVVSEVDFDSTLVGGSRELIQALVAAPDLEVYEVEPDTSLAAFSDKINLVPESAD